MRNARSGKALAAAAAEMRDAAAAGGGSGERIPTAADYEGRAIKLLALDLDNTLWDGAGAYTRSLFSSTGAVSDTRKHHAHPAHPLTPPDTRLTRATQSLRATPIP